MCSNLTVLKPSFSKDDAITGPVLLTAIVPGCCATPQRLQKYFGPEKCPILPPGDSLVLEREVNVDDASELEKEAWAFGAELQLEFHTKDPQVF